MYAFRNRTNLTDPNWYPRASHKTNYYIGLHGTIKRVPLCRKHAPNFAPFQFLTLHLGLLPLFSTVAPPLPQQWRHLNLKLLPLQQRQQWPSSLIEPSSSSICDLPILVAFLFFLFIDLSFGCSSVAFLFFQYSPWLLSLYWFCFPLACCCCFPFVFCFRVVYLFCSHSIFPTLVLFSYDFSSFLFPYFSTFFPFSSYLLFNR